MIMDASPERGGVREEERQQEGTEAAGRFLADPESRHQLKVALGLQPDSDSFPENIWFEALIRSRTVAGAPNTTTLVATRRIH